MKLYKLTDRNARTRGGMQWGPGITNAAREGVPVLCTDTVLHAYTDPLLAVLLAPIHVSWECSRLWEAEGDVLVRDTDIKVGCRTLTTTREIPLPAITTEMRVRFAILCALEVSDDAKFSVWAHGWVDGKDRTSRAAYIAATTTRGAAAAAAWAAMPEAEGEAEAAAAATAARAAEMAATCSLRPLDLARLARAACEGINP